MHTLTLLLAQICRDPKIMYFTSLTSLTHNFVIALYFLVMIN